MGTRRTILLIALAALLSVGILPSRSLASAMRRASAAPAGDQDLEPGFPVKTPYGSGAIAWGGPRIHTLVANLDEDATLETVAMAVGGDPIYAWNADGSVVSGWPVHDETTGSYLAMGNLSDSFAGLELFAGYRNRGSQPSTLAAYAGTGAHLPGWPRDSAHFVTAPPALADVDGDGIDEIFISEEDWYLHAYRADGTPLEGWPVMDQCGAGSFNMPAVADLDLDGDLEIISGSSAVVAGTDGSTIEKLCLYAFHHDGSLVEGFPAVILRPNPITFPVIGDVDGDGAPEIVVVQRDSQTPWRPVVHVVSAQGTVERTMLGSGDGPVYTAVLADLDGDSVPEILVQANRQLNVWYGDGSPFPGWPRETGGALGNSAPVIGDVDGDQQPDIVVTINHPTSSEIGEVLVYDRNGNLHPRFPKVLPIGLGAVPAIADIDLDGRNEIVVTGDFNTGTTTGEFEAAWVYDLGGPAHGRIEWGQFGGGPRHQGRYAPPSVSGPTATATTTSTPTHTRTATPTATMTQGVTSTATRTPTPTTGAASPTHTATATPGPGTPTRTQTPVSATATPPQPSPTVTPVASVTPITTSGVFLPIADTYARANTPEMNYGTEPGLRVDGGTDPKAIAYIRFSVPRLAGPVERATLRLMPTTDSEDGPVVHGTTNDWTETELTWNNRPLAITRELDNAGDFRAGVAIELDVSAFVTGEGLYSFLLETYSSDGTWFSSKEGPAAPQLHIYLQNDSARQLYLPQIHRR